MSKCCGRNRGNPMRTRIPPQVQCTIRPWLNGPGAPSEPARHRFQTLIVAPLPLPTSAFRHTLRRGRTSRCHIAAKSTPHCRGPLTLMPSIEGYPITLRPQTLSITKPLAALPLLAQMPAVPAEFRPDGKDVMTVERRANLPDGWVCDKVDARPTAGALRAALPPKRLCKQAAAPQSASNLSDVLVTSAEEAPAPVAQANASFDTDSEAPESETPMPLAMGAVQPGEVSSEVSGAEPSTLNGHMRQIGMFVLLLSILSAVTLLWLRHHRRDRTSPRRTGRRI